MTASLSYEQWWSALENATRIPSDENGARTSEEWCEVLDWSRDRFLRFIKKGHRNGWVEVTCVKRETITGHMQKRPAYRIKEQESKKKQKKK